MKWITRSHVHVDRVACPWLIERFVDSEADIIFAADSLVEKTAREENAIPFDIEDAELGHHGDDCTFRAIINKYELTDPVLLRMAEIVNAADTGDFKAHPYAAGLEALARGFSVMYPDDNENLEWQFPVYDALYAALKCEEKKVVI
ncbi:MAG: chromate resistance protein [Elusimicrobia bacterium CG_4_10_14_0_2_um_filter_56_8]|nr:MAG: chromate resistance protein [Elusimicrobia bacterium CG1_02_56_21]PJA14534.1 MAG: chromate resistance protein [Elusimicrobia bacterium CG_4_10_14_0_2_um_filter_56_8]